MLRELEPLTTTTAAYVLAVALGLVWGSFANVCIYRLPPSDEHPEGRSVVKPASHCSACKTPIAWYDNIPIASWLWLRGKCRSCKVPFSARYLLVELVTGALFGFAWWSTVEAGALFEPLDVRLVRFVIAAAFCFVMVVVTFIDLDHKLILNKVTIPSLIAFYFLGLLLPDREWWDGLIGAAVGYGVPWLIGEIYYLIRRREGLGLGDSMLLAVVGALLGWRGVCVSLFGGAVVGVFVGITYFLTRRDDDGDEDGEAGEDGKDDKDRKTAKDDAQGAKNDAQGAKADGDAKATKAGKDTADGGNDEQAEGTANGDERDERDEDAESSILRIELPFGPFLALGALFYLFAEPWIQLKLRLLGM